MFLPFSRISPSAGSYKRIRSFTRVDFPAPLYPTMAALVCALIFMLICRSTQGPPSYRKETLRNSISPENAGNGAAFSGEVIVCSAARNVRSLSANIPLCTNCERASSRPPYMEFSFPTAAMDTDRSPIETDFTIRILYTRTKIRDTFVKKTLQICPPISNTLSRNCRFLYTASIFDTQSSNSSASSRSILLILSSFA